MDKKHDHSILVIGYGNTLRGDDGVGCLVAETIADWQLPQVRSIAVHQLLPELAADIAVVHVVMFVDAVGTSCLSPGIEITPLIADNNAAFSTHIVTPQLLLSLTQRLYFATPIAYLLMISAINFTLGSSLSPIACQGKDLALNYLKDILRVHENSGKVEDLECYIGKR